LLTQRFSKHQGGVQACFRSNPDQAKSTPNVQISFNVSSSGKVNRAGLIPSSVASTPLGSCLLRVARGASFGALTESVSFRIPVSARIK
jgi:TonB family protein